MRRRVGVEKVFERLADLFGLGLEPLSSESSTWNGSSHATPGPLPAPAWPAPPATLPVPLAPPPAVPALLASAPPAPEPLFAPAAPESGAAPPVAEPLWPWPPLPAVTWPRVPALPGSEPGSSTPEQPTPQMTTNSGAEQCAQGMLGKSLPCARRMKKSACVWQSAGSSLGDEPSTCAPRHDEAVAVLSARALLRDAAMARRGCTLLRLVNARKAEYGARMRQLAALSVLGIFVVACGGSEPPPESPPQPEPVTPTVEAAPAPKPPEDAAEAPKEEPKSEKPPVVEPQFTDGMSVADAMKAVPQGAERANIDNETLGKPLQDFAVYEPCKPGTAKVKMKIAVWDGKAVGLDITATPKNDKLVACIKDRIKGLTWQAKVKSLNTVEYSF
jgi:hypothetical protein